MDNDVAGINRVGNNIVALSTELSENIKKLNWIVDKLGSCWQGEDANVYINTLRDNYLIELRKTVEIVENYGKYLKDVSKIYTDMDSDILNESRE